MSAAVENEAAPTRDASDVYDRQIRLWGAEAQSKISSANVLYIHITGVSSEILKNLVLAGVQASICDGRPYPDAMVHTPSSFLPPADRIGDTDKKSKKRKTTVAQAMQNHVHELNPLLKLPQIEERPLDQIPDSFFSQFQIVVASRVPLDQAQRISKSVIAARNKFILVDCFGLNGCAVLDLGANHFYRKEIGKDKLSDSIQTKPYLCFSDILKVKLGDVKDRWNKTCPKEYAQYRAILQYQSDTQKWPKVDDKEDFAKRIGSWLIKEEACGGNFMEIADLENLASSATCELSPVCAILGGVLGNEVVKFLSGKGEPANNLILFDGVDGGCRNFLVKEMEKETKI